MNTQVAGKSQALGVNSEVSNKKHGLSSRDRILAVAIETLSEGGAASLRVNDLAKQVGVAVTSIYHYFGSREGLVAAAHTERFRALSILDFANIRREIDRCKSLLEFREYIDSALERLIDAPANHHARLVRMETYAAAFKDPAIADMLARDAELQADRMFALLEPLKERGWIKADTDSRAFGVFLNSVLTGHLFVEIGSPAVDEHSWRAMAKVALMQVIPESNQD